MAKYQGKYSRDSKQEYAELEKSYNSISPAKKKPVKKQETPKRRKSIIGVCITVIVLAIAILTGCVYFIAFDNDVILNHVYVAGVHVGGMTKIEAERAVKAATKDTFGKTNMVVTVLDTTVEIPAEAIVDFDIRGAVQAACEYGNKGTKADREEQQRIASTTGYELDLAPYLTIDKDLINAKLGQLGSIFNSTFKDTTYEVVGEKPTLEQIQAGEGMQKIVIQLGVPEYGLDMNALYGVVMQAYSSNTFTATGTCSTVEPTPVDLKGILDQYYVAPVNAQFKSGTSEIIPGVYGYGFDLAAAQEKLQNAEYGTTVEILFTHIEPEITADNIAEKMFDDQLSTWTAEAESDSNRQTNLRLACEAINGIVLFPGETFSYNKALGERTEERGYKPGASYSGNQTVYTVGGGICQVSSALYYCVLHADLEIVHRDNHGFAQTYVPLGMDATVSWGSIDFLFKNNSNNPIRIEAKAEGGKTTVSIYGIDDKDYTVKVEYEILSETKSTDTTQEMPADNAEGFKDGDYIVEPYNGYHIVTYRCRYDKATGKLISKDEEATSIYRVRNGIICKIAE